MTCDAASENLDRYLIIPLPLSLSNNKENEKPLQSDTGKGIRLLGCLQYPPAELQ